MTQLLKFFIYFSGLGGFCAIFAVGFVNPLVQNKVLFCIAGIPVVIALTFGFLWLDEQS